VPARSDQDGDVVHLYCCDPDLALCGEDLTDHDDNAEGPECPPCAVIDVVDQPCPVPGCEDR
jgi:hypothetical protein